MKKRHIENIFAFFEIKANHFFRTSESDSSGSLFTSSEEEEEEESSKPRARPFLPPDESPFNAMPRDPDEDDDDEGGAAGAASPVARAPTASSGGTTETQREGSGEQKATRE